ncbi:MAG: aminotransferase class V-fold PLP-dependent enzyme [Longimicrobiales bacterium]
MLPGRESKGLEGIHYLDYAATAAVRPPQVTEAVRRFLSEVGATPGRGGHRLSLEAGRVAHHCRVAVCRILGVPEDPTRVALTLNATQGVNLALRGVLHPGDTVVTTAYDHNAVLRPVHLLEEGQDVRHRQVAGAPDGSIDLEQLRRELRGARLLVVNAVSNVLGTRLPLREMAALAREMGALVLVDAAQWAGHFVGGLGRAGADLVAFTGHKGLLGPQGIGGLWVRAGIDLDPFVAGGTGGDSLRREMPEAYPDHLEAGSGNAPGMAGLLAGIEFLEAEGVERIHRKEMGLKAVLWDGVQSLPGVRVLSPPAPEGVGIVTLVSDRVDPPTIAERLDREWGVMVRYGLNCAPEVHRLLGTDSTGAVRLSLGWASTPRDVEEALRGLDDITSSPVVPVS